MLKKINPDSIWSFQGIDFSEMIEE